MVHGALVLVHVIGLEANSFLVKFVASSRDDVIATIVFVWVDENADDVVTHVPEVTDEYTVE